MRKFTNIERFSIKISILSKSEKKVLKFKWLFYAQGTEVKVPVMGGTPNPKLGFFLGTFASCRDTCDRCLFLYRRF